MIFKISGNKSEITIEFFGHMPQCYCHWKYDDIDPQSPTQQSLLLVNYYWTWVGSIKVSLCFTFLHQLSFGGVSIISCSVTPLLAYDDHEIWTRAIDTHVFLIIVTGVVVYMRFLFYSKCGVLGWWWDDDAADFHSEALLFVGRQVSWHALVYCDLLFISHWMDSQRRRCEKKVNYHYIVVIYSGLIEVLK